MSEPAPVFISYARKDYYFAESLAFHLQRHRVPVWLDVKDLTPGIDWQQQLEAAIDGASAVLVIVSADSIKRPSVRLEWERAVRSGKRVIVILFRKARIPDQLAGCERVDFHLAFATPLRRLIQLLAGVPAQAQAANWLPLPPWILILTIALLLPLVSYFGLADWSSNGKGSSEALVLVLLPFFVIAFFWFFCVSFLRRRMGMTHLAASFAFPAIWSVYPMVRYWGLGSSDIPPVWRAALTRNPLPMEISAALTILGFAILFVVRPEDLLRWTPTGRAWGWYRRRYLLSGPNTDRPSILRQVKTYSLLHHAADGPAALRLRQTMKDLGAAEVSDPGGAATTILLLTARTQTQWLGEQTPRLNSNLLTVVGSRIGLPESFDWLWKREWIDFRHWDLTRLDNKRGLLPVPEAVTNIRYPRPVRIVHHLMCALIALDFCLFLLGNPEFNSRPSGDEGPPLETAEMLLCSALCIWGGIAAQRLLNRTTSRAGFERGCKILLAATGLLAIATLYSAAVRNVAGWRLAVVVVFLIFLPWLLWTRRDQIAFWFPTPRLSRPGSVPRLRAGRQWQTLLWASVYMFVWGYILSIYDR